MCRDLERHCIITALKTRSPMTLRPPSFGTLLGSIADGMERGTLTYPMVNFCRANVRKGFSAVFVSLESWRTRLSSFCLGSICNSPPSPPEGSNIQASNVTQLKTPIGEGYFYECVDGHLFDHDPSLQNISVTCLTDNQWEGIDWPKCVKPEGKIPA